MSDSSRRGFVDPRGEENEELTEELLQTVREAHRLRHLYDIFRGEKEDPESYYGENADAFDNPRHWASNLAGSFPEESSEFMNRADAEFTHHNLKKNAVVDYLAEEEIPREVTEELEPSWLELLLLAYHALYDPESGEARRYPLLIANSRLFKFRSKLTYSYDSLNLEDLDARATTFMRSYNDSNSRPLSINCHRVDNGNFVLDFYKESARVAQPVFDIRDGDSDADPLEPSIQYDSTFSIKTLSVSITGEGDQYDVTYSKSIGNWKRLMRQFFDEVFNRADPFEDELRKRTDSVEDILESAFEVLDQDSASDEDVIEAVDSEVDELSEAAAASEEAEKSSYANEELSDIYESLELVGVSVKGADEALTDTFQVSSTATLREWTEKNVSDSDSLKRVVADAEPESIGFLFRGNLRGEDSPPEEFVLQDGVWKSGAGGVSDDANELLNILFQSHDE